MPDSTRFFAKKELNRACGNLSWALKHLARVKEKAEPNHPLLAAKFDRLLSEIKDCYDRIDYINKVVL